MKQSKKRMMTAAAVTAAVAASILGAAGCGAAGASTTGAVSVPDTIRVENVEGAGETITVTGREEVKVVPDMAQIEYAVYTQADTADACQTENAENLNKTIETLKGLGVGENSIQTSAYGLNPIYDWNSGNQEITGYEMTTRITVSDIPIDQAGTILSQSVVAGVNQIDAVSYFSSNYDASYQEALKGGDRCRAGKSPGDCRGRRKDRGGDCQCGGVRLQPAGPLFQLQRGRGCGGNGGGCHGYGSHAWPGECGGPGECGV